MNGIRQFSKYVIVGLFLNVTWVTNVSHAEAIVATYELDVAVTWSQDNHETWADPFEDTEGVKGVLNPHFSHLGGGTHNSDIIIWKEGETASAGMETMQESGWIDFKNDDGTDNPNVHDLAVDFAKYIDDGDAHSFLEWQPVTPNFKGFAPGTTTTLEFDIQSTHPLVSLMTMIGPSPDWFVGVSGLDLRSSVAGESTNGWVDELTVELFPYDGGTEHCDTVFSLDCDDDDSPVAITRIMNTPTVNTPGNTALKNMSVGTFTFKLQSVAVPEPSSFLFLGLATFGIASRATYFAMKARSQNG